MRNTYSPIRKHHAFKASPKHSNTMPNSRPATTSTPNARPSTTGGQNPRRDRRTPSQQRSVRPSSSYSKSPSKDAALAQHQATHTPIQQSQAASHANLYFAKRKIMMVRPLSLEQLGLSDQSSLLSTRSFDTNREGVNRHRTLQRSDSAKHVQRAQLGVKLRRSASVKSIGTRDFYGIQG